MVPRERHTLFATDPLARPLKEVDCDADCEQSLIFLCKVTARESSKYASGEAMRRDKRGRKAYKRVRSPSFLVSSQSTSWFAIALAEIRTRRIFKRKGGL